MWGWSALCKRQGVPLDRWQGVPTFAVERAVKAQSVQARAMARQYIPKEKH